MTGHVVSRRKGHGFTLPNHTTNRAGDGQRVPRHQNREKVAEGRGPLGDMGAKGPDASDGRGAAGCEQQRSQIPRTPRPLRLPHCRPQRRPPHTPRPHLFTGSPPLEHVPPDSKDRRGPMDTCHENPRMQEECQDRRGRATARKSLATGRGRRQTAREGQGSQRIFFTVCSTKQEQIEWFTNHTPNLVNKEINFTK